MNELPVSPPPGGEGVGRPLRIVVADHDPSVGPLHRETLARLGYQACTATTGRQLVEQCRLLHPDLAIIEIELPDLAGIAAAEEVCRDQPTPIILLSSGQDASIVRAQANPYVLACLLKPVKEADLRAAIAVAMARFEQFQSLRQEAADLRQALEDRKHVERAKGMVMKYARLDEEEAYRRLKKLASVQNRRLVEVAQAVVVAGEVFQQLEQPPQDGKPDGVRARHADGRQPIRQTRRATPLRRKAPSDHAPSPEGGQGAG